MKLVRLLAEPSQPLLLAASQVRHSYPWQDVLPWLAQEQDGCSRAQQLFVSGRLLPCAAFFMSAAELARWQPDWKTWLTQPVAAQTQLIELILDPALGAQAAQITKADRPSTPTYSAWLICPCPPQTLDDQQVLPLPWLLRATATQPWWIGYSTSSALPLALAEVLFRQGGHQ
ncbi:hypothetical protein V6U78_06975 [Marinospirillum sp. MEB164]|uniref:Uncharacterized protein n=1 Tax=Marinospirillum alkalitolerans TaxID=3123374 RepID=A0ABW8PWU6_9GAMM